MRTFDNAEDTLTLQRVQCSTSRPRQYPLLAPLFYVRTEPARQSRTRDDEPVEALRLEKPGAAEDPTLKAYITRR
jgi:hypothetical protein